MRIIHDLDEMTETARGWLAGGSVGFVPTMGYLHEGHLALVRAAHQECEISVVSIFINPLQFSRDEDLISYPVDPERDLQLLSDANVDVVFIPRAEEVYPAQFSTYVTPTGPTIKRLEGLTAPGYIRGVATIMTKLFQLVRPDVAYFGQKNAPQITVVRKLLRDLNIDVHLRVLPTVRESGGLALSSQAYALTPVEQEAARVVYRALLTGKALIEQGQHSAAAIEKAMVDTIATEPLIELDYAHVYHPETFLVLKKVLPGAMLAIAAHIGRVRLLDNIVWREDANWLL